MLRLSNGEFEPPHTVTMEDQDGFPALPGCSSQGDIPDLPSAEVALAIYKSFLAGHKQTNCLVDAEELAQDLHRVYEPGGLSNPCLCASRFRCFTVLYLAQEQYWIGRNGQEHRHTSFQQLYRRLALKDACAAVSKQDLVRFIYTAKSASR